MRVAKPEQIAERRRRVVEAAMNLAGEKGLDGLSMRRLADSLGYTTGMLYGNFKSKDELLHEMLFIVYQEIYEILQKLPLTDDPADDLRRFVHANLKYMHEKRFRPELFMLISAKVPPEMFPESMKQTIQIYVDIMARMNIPPEKLLEQQVVLRTYTRGIHSLLLAQESEEARAETQKIMEHGLDSLIFAWMSGK